MEQVKDNQWMEDNQEQAEWEMWMGGFMEKADNVQGPPMDNKTGQEIATFNLDEEQPLELEQVDNTPKVMRKKTIPTKSAVKDVKYPPSPIHLWIKRWEDNNKQQDTLVRKTTSMEEQKTTIVNKQEQKYQEDDHQEEFADQDSWEDWADDEVSQLDRSILDPGKEDYLALKEDDIGRKEDDRRNTGVTSKDKTPPLRATERQEDKTPTSAGVPDMTSQLDPTKENQEDTPVSMTVSTIPLEDSLTGRPQGTTTSLDGEYEPNVPIHAAKFEDIPRSPPQVATTGRGVGSEDKTVVMTADEDKDRKTGRQRL